jgi:hypothetical protein
MKELDPLLKDAIVKARAKGFTVVQSDPDTAPALTLSKGPNPNRFEMIMVFTEKDGKWSVSINDIGKPPADWKAPDIMAPEKAVEWVQKEWERRNPVKPKEEKPDEKLNASLKRVDEKILVLRDTLIVPVSLFETPEDLAACERMEKALDNLTFAVKALEKDARTALTSQPVLILPLDGEFYLPGVQKGADGKPVIALEPGDKDMKKTILECLAKIKKEPQPNEDPEKKNIAIKIDEKHGDIYANLFAKILPNLKENTLHTLSAKDVPVTSALKPNDMHFLMRDGKVFYQTKGKHNLPSYSKVWGEVGDHSKTYLQLSKDGKDDPEASLFVDVKTAEIGTLEVYLHDGKTYNALGQIFEDDKETNLRKAGDIYIGDSSVGRPEFFEIKDGRVGWRNNKYIQFSIGDLSVAFSKKGEIAGESMPGRKWNPDTFKTDAMKEKLAGLKAGVLNMRQLYEKASYFSWLEPKAQDNDPGLLKILENPDAQGKDLGKAAVLLAGLLLKEGPNDPKINNSISWALSQSKEINSSKEAVALALRCSKIAVEGDPKNAEYADVYAAAHAANNDKSQAVAWEQKAIDLATDDPKREYYKKVLELYRKAKE